MTVARLLYEFELAADKVDSKNAMNLSLPAKLAYLNRGQITLILNRYDGRNSTGRGFEQTRLRSEDLQMLVVPEEKLKVQLYSQDIYTSNIADTKEKYMILLRQYGIGSIPRCGNKAITITDVTHNELEQKLKDPFWTPSFQWRTALMTTANNKFWIYTNGFSIDSLTIDYLRYPREIDSEGYINYKNEPSENVDCELPVYLHYSVIDEAVCNLKSDLGDPSYQTAIYKLAKKE